MATKKTAATEFAAKKTSKKGSKTKSAKPAKIKVAKNVAAKASAPPAEGATKKTRGPKVSGDDIRRVLGNGASSVGNIAAHLGATKHAVRRALKGMGSAVSATGKTVDRMYALAS